MSSPTGRLETLVIERKLRTGGNPVLSLMASRVTIETNTYGEVRPVKKKSTGRIDGIVAMIFALGAWEKKQVVNVVSKVKPGILIL
jgi:phage terminase large subunit-like protein